MAGLKYIFQYLLLFYKLTPVTSFKENGFNLNVLFIFVDDLRHLDFKKINLPHIKKLAVNGITFKNSFAQVRTTK